MELYNVEDIDYLEYIRGLSLLGKKIPFYNKSIRHFSVEEILEMGQSNYNELISVFALNKKFLCNNQDVDIGLLEIICVHNEAEDILEKIFSGLKMLLELEKEPEILVVNDDDKNSHIEIVVDGTLFINSEKYEQLRKITLFMNHVKDAKIDTKSKNKIANETDKKRFEKLFKGRKKEAEKEDRRNTILNVYNCVVHMQNPINYEYVAGWSIYRLYNTFNNLRIYEDYDFNRNLYSSGMVELKKATIPIYFNEITKK